MAEGVANKTSLPRGIAKLGRGYSEARFVCGRCLFNDSAHGMAKLGHGIVIQVIAEGVADLTTPPEGMAKLGQVITIADIGCKRC